MNKELVFGTALFHLKDCLQIKYLGEDGENIPVAGAVAVCSPWDLLVSILILKFIFCISVGIDQCIKDL